MELDPLFDTGDLKSLITIPGEILKSYFTEEFTYKHLNIPSYVIINWTNSGAIEPKKKKANELFKFTFVEYIWLNIIKDLRDIGVSFDKILKVKEHLLKEFTLKEIYDSIGADEIKKAVKNAKADTQEEKELVRKFQTGDLFKKTGNIKINTLFYSLIHLIRSRHDVQLLIDMEGNAMAYDDFFISHSDIKEITNDCLIVLPIKKYLKAFLVNPENVEFISRTKLLNDNEIHIMSLIRDGKAKSIKVKLSDGKPVMLEIEHEKKLQCEARLAEILIKEGYEELVVKTNEGIITYAKSVSTMKLK